MKKNIQQETLRRRQQAFKKTEEEIEARLAEEEQELKRQEEDHIYEQQKNHIGNSSGRDSGMLQRIIKSYLVLFVNVISNVIYFS